MEPASAEPIRFLERLRSTSAATVVLSTLVTTSPEITASHTTDLPVMRQVQYRAHDYTCCVCIMLGDVSELYVCAGESESDHIGSA